MDITIIMSGQSSSNSSLEQFLVRGNMLKSKNNSSIENLFDQFGHDYFETEELPVAATSALTDLENSEGKIWMRTDPVFLHADLTSLLLFDSRSFSLTKEETIRIFSTINPLLEEDGLHLVCGADPSRWYLKLENNPSMTTTPAGIVNGHDIRPFLPEGKDRDFWIRLANEIQILLHDCSINKERKQRGQVPINSVWFWGAGKLPGQMNCKFEQIISNDVNAKGLAIHSGIPHETIPENIDQFLSKQEKSQNILIVLSQGDLALSETEDQEEWLIFDYLLMGLKKGRIKKLEIITDDQHCIVKRSHLYRFWRKEKT